MCSSVGVQSFEFPNLIVSKDVILIDPHVIQVRVPLPLDQILQLFALTKLLRIQNILDLIFLFVIYQIRRLGTNSWRCVLLFPDMA